MARVSVLVPAYNAAPFLAATLRSVLDGRFRDLEILVLDDGSSDGTADVARALGDPRVRVVSHSNRGMSATRNAGLALSQSDYVALLDADDLWHPDKLALQVQLLDQRPELDFCFTEFQPWQGEPRPDFMQQPADARLDPGLTGWVYPRMIMTNFALPSSVLMRRQLADRLGPFLCDDHQTDDWEYFVRASRQAQFGKLAAPLVLYRQHPGSLSKRVPERNSTELMRDQLLQRYGMSCPQGGAVDARELQRRRQMGWRHFADAHVARGRLGLGLRTFGRLLLAGPRRLDTLATLAKSTRRRLLGAGR